MRPTVASFAVVLALLGGCAAAPASNSKPIPGADEPRRVEQINSPASGWSATPR